MQRMSRRVRYGGVQPYGRSPGEWTVLSEHASTSEAFAALDAVSAQIVRRSAPSDAVELIGVDEGGERERPETHGRTRG